MYNNWLFKELSQLFTKFSFLIRLQHRKIYYWKCNINYIHIKLFSDQLKADLLHLNRKLPFSAFPFLLFVTTFHMGVISIDWQVFRIFLEIFHWREKVKPIYIYSFEKYEIPNGIFRFYSPINLFTIIESYQHEI